MCDWLNDEHSAADLAKVLGVTRQALTRYRKQGLPMGPGGGHLLTPCVEWFVRHEVAKAAPSDADAALKESRKRLLDQEFERRAGKLIERDAAQRDIDAAVVEARGILEGLPAKLLADISPEGKFDRDEIEAAVVRRVRLTLRALERGRPGDADTIETDPEPATVPGEVEETQDGE